MVGAMVGQTATAEAPAAEVEAIMMAKVAKLTEATTVAEVLGGQ